jgi:hypothetical protein
LFLGQHFKEHEEIKMTKWELNTLCAHIEDTPSEIWTKDKKTGKSAWDDIKALASDGWELVSVTPIAWGGFGGTHFVLYTFKRPVT